mmetsp:Transcript_24325/g.35645  ORF Transcript_24325/g.35645 Transcript_24325/m.35645 type:complete len:402 (+) Transcript_24325:117-1322(+)|eukprot:CAMPEP_0185030430 /NCGR_PEP_ID=MMETSP1103-20130426/17398_1 /TAXON_ID=36769 /ORGANISM="Paraphysomonas bandaiensis, Strain Caron Lab Isolate" /LENGTH=401 /DNA_ID=CAMNT_0027565563 /DNA_START=47 /DNA_END=1252 /DNA_ORIENTATION=+
MAEEHAAHVQAQLQTYLDSKDFNTIFTKLVENVLEAKPPNPVEYMVEYLLEAYPDETEKIHSRFIKAEEVEKEVIEETPRSTAEDSDSDNEEGLDEEEKIQKRRARAMAVSAEPIDPKTLKERMKLIPVYEKSEEDAATLMEIIHKSQVLMNLDEEPKDQVLKALSGPLIKQPGEDIIIQGESGDVFYLLESGEVDVFVRKGGGEESLVHTYSAGSTFGELALLYNAPRAATCRASSECRLWSLDRLTFRVLVVGATIRKREKYMSFLRQVPILDSLSEMEVMAVADALLPAEFSDEAVVCKEGEVGDTFYIIESGEAICTQRDPTTGYENVVSSLTTGHYFGEIALLEKKHRQATVRAAPKQTLKVLFLDKATFKRIFGPLDPILRRNMDNYNKFHARDI